MPKYPSTDAFIQAVIQEYYHREGHSNRGKLNFLILLFASGEAVPTISSYLKGISLPKKLAASAISLITLRLLLGRLLSGPFGILLSAASIASLTTLAYKNREKIAQTIGIYREKIEHLKLNYEKLLEKLQNEVINEQDFDLMTDGLKSRFFEEFHS